MVGSTDVRNTLTLRKKIFCERAGEKRAMIEGKKTDEELQALLDEGVPEYIVNREKRFRRRPSTTYIEEYVDNAGNVKKRIRLTKGGFCDEKKRIFLSIYSRTNRMKESASLAGVSMGTVREHIKTDTDFGEAVLEAEQSYRDHVVAHIQDLCFNGVERKTYDRNGNLVSEEIQYPVKLIEMEAKRVEPGYRDKQQVDVNHTGGVLVAPSSLGSIEEWEQKFGNKTIDASYEEVQSLPSPTFGDSKIGDGISDDPSAKEPA